MIAREDQASRESKLSSDYHNAESKNCFGLEAML